MAIHIPKDIEKWDLLDYSNYGMKCIGMDTIAILQYNKTNILKLKRSN